jgi:WhiB family redox-sensing transcriptional regulator
MSLGLMLLDDDHDGLRWLDEIACADADLSEYFVAAGHTISPEAKARCNACPVRRQCLTHAYERDIDAGYMADVSPSQRRRMTLPEALESIGLAA